MGSAQGVAHLLQCSIPGGRFGRAVVNGTQEAVQPFNIDRLWCGDSPGGSHALLLPGPETGGTRIRQSYHQTLLVVRFRLAVLGFVVAQGRTEAGLRQESPDCHPGASSIWMIHLPEAADQDVNETHPPPGWRLLRLTRLGGITTVRPTGFP
ncbi:MAG TPA: hypothetical protein VGE22_03590 [Solimonas sp.]